VSEFITFFAIFADQTYAAPGKPANLKDD